MNYKPIQIQQEVSDMKLKKYRDFVIGDYNETSGTQNLTNLPDDFDRDNFHMLFLNDDYIYFGDTPEDDAEYSDLNNGQFIIKTGYEIDISWNIELVYEPSN